MNQQELLSKYFDFSKEPWPFLLLVKKGLVYFLVTMMLSVLNVPPVLTQFLNYLTSKAFANGFLLRFLPWEIGNLGANWWPTVLFFLSTATALSIVTYQPRAKMKNYIILGLSNLLIFFMLGTSPIWLVVLAAVQFASHFFLRQYSQIYDNIVAHLADCAWILTAVVLLGFASHW